jgi:tRNA-binding protein
MKKIKVAPIKPTVAFDVFEKIDIRVGTIKRVEDIEGADKLVRMIVDFGNHQRTRATALRNSR